MALFSLAVVRRKCADEAIAIHSPTKYSPRLHRYSNAGFDERAEARSLVGNRWTPIKIVATSGLVPIKDNDLSARSVFLRKPYRGDEVVAVLRELTGTA